MKFYKAKEQLSLRISYIKVCDDSIIKITSFVIWRTRGALFPTLSHMLAV